MVLSAGMNLKFCCVVAKRTPHDTAETRYAANALVRGHHAGGSVSSNLGDGFPNPSGLDAVRCLPPGAPRNEQALEWLSAAACGKSLAP